MPPVTLAHGLPPPEIICMSAEKVARFAGTNHGSPGPWLSLECAGSECRIEERAIRATPITVEPHDGDPVPGQRIEVVAPVAPLFVLRGVAGVRVGKVTTYYHAAPPAIPPPPGPFGSRSIRVATPMGPVDIVPMKGKGGVRIRLFQGKESQVLGTIPEDGIVGTAGIAKGAGLLRWAGDMDGDGRPDFLMSLNDRVGERSQYTLFLSGKAKKGTLVGVGVECSYWPPENPGC